MWQARSWEQPRHPPKWKWTSAGRGPSYSTIRLRHAYFNLDWGKTAGLVGQTWHPLFGDVSPQILNLSVGAPFQPFSRAPQIRYRFNNKHLQLTGALGCQGPDLS